MDLDKLIKRHFTKELENNDELTVYDLFNWKTTDVKLVDLKNNKVLFDKKDLEFPEHYSQNACDIIASRYFRMAGVNNEVGYERSMKEVTHRMVGFWTAAALAEGLISTEQAPIFYDELAYMLLDQRWAPNSPQWFNTGHKFAYDLTKEPEDFYYYDIEQDKVVKSKDAYTRTFGSACFIISINDALLGHKSISDQLVTETRLFKYGAGTGSNFSSLRATGEKLSGGGTSSGLMSFLRVFDRNAGAIKSGGTTRRAAKIVCLDADHPEIIDFIEWKAKEEDKVVALGKMGYDTDFNGEAYDTVSGQNSNNSIQFTDELMRKMLGKDPDTSWELKGRVDSSVNRTIDAKEIWEKWNYAAWRCGDPAPQFYDTINAWHTCPAGEDGVAYAPYNMIRSSNPCSEYFFLDDTACNLASINVVKFYDPLTGEFDIEGYLHAITLIQMVLETTIFWGQFPTEVIARRSHLFRSTGLGIANTGALHMMMAHPYDSDEARAVASALVGIMTGQSYAVSAMMAEKVGAFPKYEINKEYMLEVIRNHARVAGVLDSPYERLKYTPQKVNHNLLTELGYAKLSDTLKEVWNNAVSLGEKYGFRNAQVTVIAPTGTIAFAMDCATTSIEPFFAHAIIKKLAGGGYIEIANPAIEIALRKLGYSESQIVDILNYILKKETVDINGTLVEMIADGKIEGAPHLKEEHLPIFDTANKCGTGERFISPMGHIKMMAALTPLISGAISKTVNMPNSATIDDFKEIHKTAWELGVKAVALYRDGCKASQPLNSAINTKKNNLEDKTYKELLDIATECLNNRIKPTRKRPVGISPARIHRATLDGLKLIITVSFYDDGKLAEIYVEADKEGTTVKGLLDSLSKNISKMIQYNIPYEEIIRSLKGQKYEPHGFVSGHRYIKYASSISDLISKVLEIELGDFSSCQVKPEDGEFFTQEQIVKGVHLQYSSESESDNFGFEEKITKPSPSVTGDRVYGKSCPNCGSSDMRKNGTCYVCASCGETTGCS